MTAESTTYSAYRIPCDICKKERTCMSVITTGEEEIEFSTVHACGSCYVGMLEAADDIVRDDRINGSTRGVA